MPSKKRRTPGADDENEIIVPFTLRIRPPSKTQPSKGPAWHRQKSIFDPKGDFHSDQSMDVEWSVTPSNWFDLRVYKSFQLTEGTYSVNQFVYVANEGNIKRIKLDGFIDLDQGPRPWVGRIVEIRASDAQNVFARVVWLYWPEELPSSTVEGGRKIRGRQPYHGKHELVASNHMDIIHATSVIGVAQVTHWDEDDDDATQTTLYWRQAFDSNTRELSSSKIICRCRTPSNPDHLLIRCSSASCKNWMHEQCLRHDALIRVHQRLGSLTPQTFEADIIDEAEGVLSKSSEPRQPDFWVAQKQAAEKEPYYELFDAALQVEDNAPIVSEITDLRRHVEGGSKKWLETAYCLLCNEVID